MQRRPLYSALALGLAFILFAGPAIADLGTDEDLSISISNVDPKTATFERQGDKLHIHFKLPDGTSHKMVKELEEIKPGTEFFHWTIDPGSLEWMRSGNYPEENLEQLKVPTGNDLQYHGPGFYVSKSPTNSSTHGDILTQLRVGARPRSLLERFSKKPEESFWVIKEDLFFPGATTAERNKVAQALYPLLMKEGVSGTRIHETWYTFFDHAALTGFHPVDPEHMIAKIKENQSDLPKALTKLKQYPQNAKTYAALEGALTKQIEEASSVPELETWIPYAKYLGSPRVESGLLNRVSALLPGLTAETTAEQINPFFYWAADRKDPALFEKVLDKFLSTHPNAWSDSELQSTLSSIIDLGNKEIERSILDRVSPAIASAKTTEELDQLFNSAWYMKYNPELSPRFYDKLAELLKSGNYGKAYPMSWARILSAQKQADPSLLLILAKEMANLNPRAWNDSDFEEAILRILRNGPSQEFKAGLIQGLAGAIEKQGASDDLYYFAARINEPAARNLVIQGVRKKLEAAVTDPSIAYRGMRLMSYLEEPSPEELRQVLALALKNKDLPHFASYVSSGLIDYLKLETRGPEVKKVALSFLAQLQATLPPGKNLLDEIPSADRLLRRLDITDLVDLPKYAGDVDFGLAKAASPDCGDKFKAVAGQP